MSFNFGSILRDLRKSHNLTQGQLAEKLDVAKSTISMYEIEERSPDMEMLLKISNVFNVDVNYLFGIAPEQKEMNKMGREPYKREEKKVEKKKSPEGLVTGNMCLMAWFNKMDIHIHELPYDEALELYYAAAEEWPDGLPLKPDEWEGLGERKQVEYLQYVRGLVEMRVGKKALSRYRHKKEEGMTDQQFDDWWESNQQRRLIEELDDRYRNRQTCNNNRNNSDNVGALSEAVALNREAVTLSRKRVAFSRKLFALQCTLFGIELALFAFLLILTLFFN